MKKIAFIGLAALLISGCNEHKPKVTYSFVGGFIGSSHTIVIDEKQIMKKDYLALEGTNDIKYSPITKEEYKQLDYLLHDADIFNVHDKYYSNYVIYDAINKIILVTEEDKTKNICIETGAEVPKKLNTLLEYITKLENEKFKKVEK